MYGGGLNTFDIRIGNGKEWEWDHGNGIGMGISHNIGNGNGMTWEWIAWEREDSENPVIPVISSRNALPRLFPFQLSSAVTSCPLLLLGFPGQFRPLIHPRSPSNVARSVVCVLDEARTRSLAVAMRPCDCCIILKSGSYTKAI